MPFSTIDDNTRTIFTSLFDPIYLVWNQGEVISTDLSGCVDAYIAGKCTLESPFFSDSFYLSGNHDVLISKQAPLLHYALYGSSESRRPTCYYDPNLNKSTTSSVDIHARYANSAYLYFLWTESADGWDNIVDIDAIRRDKRQHGATNAEIILSIFNGSIIPTRFFDAGFYIAQCNIKKIDIDRPPFLHYIDIGWKWGVDPHPLFDGEYYAIDQNNHTENNYPASPLAKFLNSSDNCKYSPSPFVDMMHLRHLMSIEGYTYVSDWRLIIDSLETEWVSLHPDIHRRMIKMIVTQEPFDAGGKLDVQTSDIVNIITNIRLGSHSNAKPKTGAQITAKSNISDDASHNAKVTISVVILNYFRPIFSIISCYSAVCATRSQMAEIILIDNGSSAFDVELLYRHCGRFDEIKLLTLKDNRFFGEGNNIAFDHAVGDFVLLLNNDAVINSNTISHLLSALSDNPILGAVSPVLVLPGGKTQELGGIVSPDGQVIQRAKHMDLNTALSIPAEKGVSYCDYVSAACMMLKREVLERVKGFDLTFDPLYYEDTDFCLRIRALGFKVGVSLNAFAIHFENASTTKLLGDTMPALIDSQRKKFSNRWYKTAISYGEKIDTPNGPRSNLRGKYDILTISQVSVGYSQKKVAWIFTPYDIRIGGGERYILSIAEALSVDFEVWVLTYSNISTSRIEMTLDDLNIAHCRLHFALLDEVACCIRPDIFICMGNEIEPPVAAMGRKNYYHCQFPFPIHYTGRFSMAKIRQYDHYIVNSEFTKRNIELQVAKYGIESRPITVVSPPVSVSTAEQQEEVLLGKRDNSSVGVCTIGRFAQGGHDKRQDIFLDVAAMCEARGHHFRFEIMGGVGASSGEMQHFGLLSERAKSLDVRLEGNASRSDVESMLVRSQLYFHPCGYGWYPGVRPERLEHFGISVIEAMSFGAIPIVYEWGGPADILKQCGVGRTFRTLPDVVKIFEEHSRRSTDQKLDLMRKAMQASHNFSDVNFRENIKRLVNDNCRETG